jgi:hypothetical protein
MKRSGIETRSDLDKFDKGKGIQGLKWIQGKLGKLINGIKDNHTAWDATIGDMIPWDIE